MEQERGETGVQADWLTKAESIRLQDYYYDLPDERIAHYPLDVRDQSKLLIYQNGTINHRIFSDLPAQLPADTLLVFNDTRVIPARAYFQKETGAVIEILLLHPEMPTRVINDAMLVRNECIWECMIGNKKRWKSADTLKTTVEVHAEPVTLEVSYADYEQNHVYLKWSGGFTFLEIVQALGEIPLPPYLNRDTEEGDKQTYQTVYANHDGAVAAPTAGLHFTENVFEELARRGISRSFLTLHVGAGTFLPIKVTSVTAHRMHSEQIVFSRELIEALRSAAGPVVPVGTTSMRSLESLYWFGVKLFRNETTEFRIEKLYPYPFEESDLPTASESLAAIAAFMDLNNYSYITGETEIFIFPGYRFRLCKGLVTNFHQPGSTLILLVAALVGSAWKQIYQEAFDKGYRFLSYGDSSLLWPAAQH
ncbi:S-adenosylmethionine:tRNA ribosyltransferase-isomerase [Dyadobacter sp. Leaf189]|uniref:S-adenosylmethionine:tRNA ribosyltransferase-isomerase n=1 Tax=Dyadobacter sp. Leaf189 TaxID=1736295 RepID=UPI0006F9038E|nr:S-adenosylmethionine:tRNA ribosyltransferase-isomerase [Dyadobacter sp. Leaf189]KQS23835.1 S-adenosylmethionine tRNA ribosyltransferase [Dyadobacter sp. Leaf189]